MNFDFPTKDFLDRCIKLKLLEPLPGFIIRTNQKIKVYRPPTKIRRPEVYDFYRKRFAEQLPDWVHQCNSQHAFYFKIWQIADKVDDLNICQELDYFMQIYNQGEPLFTEDTTIDFHISEETAEDSPAASGPGPDTDLEDNNEDFFVLDNN
tara:strand:+ start:220 stop:672 length:453 start_codon:yes stop_codon:yes gene_type:complete